MRILILMWITLYIAQGVYTYGTFNAELYWENKQLHHRDKLGLLVFFSVLPVGFMIAAVATNFNQHGFTLRSS